MCMLELHTWNVGSLMMTIITSVFFLFEYKIEKSTNGGKEGDALWHQVGRLTNSFRARGKIKKQGSVPMCHPIRGLCYLSASLICQSPIQSKHSRCIQRPASRLSLWICLFILVSGSLLEHDDSWFKLILLYKYVGEWTVKNKSGGCMHCAFSAAPYKMHPSM